MARLKLWRILPALTVGLLLSAAPGTGHVEVVGTVPNPAVSLAHAGALHALTLGGELWRLDGAPRRLATELSPDAPLVACAGRTLAVTRGGGLWWGRQIPLGGLSPLAGPACAPDGVALMLTASGGLRRVSPDGAVAAHAAIDALPDAHLRLADLRGDGHPLLAVLAGPDSARYVHGVLGDGLEATRLLVLDPLTLRVVASLELPAPYVFEDLEARPVRLGNTWTLATVRSGPQGGAALVLIGLRGRELAVLAEGPEFGRMGRWLAPLTDSTALYAVHTPHLGGVLHRYEPGARGLKATRLIADLGTHRIGERRITGGVWRGTVWAGTHDGAATVSWPSGRRLSAAPSSPLVSTPHGAYLGLADGRVVRLPDRP